MPKAQSRSLNSAPKRLPAQFNGNLEKALLSYVAAATAAGVGALAGARPAAAEVVYTPAQVEPTPGTYYLDINHDGIDDFKFVLAHSSRCQGLCTTSARIHHHTAFTSQNGKLAVYGLDSNEVFGEGSVASALRIGAQIGPERQISRRQQDGQRQ